MTKHGQKITFFKIFIFIFYFFKIRPEQERIQMLYCGLPLTDH